MADQGDVKSYVSSMSMKPKIFAVLQLALSDTSSSIQVNQESLYSQL